MDYICCPACKGNLDLSVEEEQKSEVIRGELICLKCKKHYNIINGTPCLLFPDQLEKSDTNEQRSYDRVAKTYELRMRYLALKEGVWIAMLLQTRSRKMLVDRLQLNTNDSVLETGTGTGLALPSIAKQVGEGGSIHGSDISSGMLLEAKKKINSKKISAELVQANASHLPYRDCLFHGVLHIGGWNQFSDKKQAMQEMCRVARPGSKIVICDEGLAPGKGFNWISRHVFKRSANKYQAEPPVDIIPSEIQNSKKYWVWNDVYWVLELSK